MIKKEAPKTLKYKYKYSVCGREKQKKVTPVINRGKVTISVSFRQYRSTIQHGLVLRRFRFTTIHFYDTCRAAPSTSDLWCISVATQASFLYSVRL